MLSEGKKVTSETGKSDFPNLTRNSQRYNYVVEKLKFLFFVYFIFFIPFEVSVTMCLFQLCQKQIKALLLKY